MKFFPISHRHRRFFISLGHTVHSFVTMRCMLLAVVSIPVKRISLTECKQTPNRDHWNSLVPTIVCAFRRIRGRHVIRELFSERISGKRERIPWERRVRARVGFQKKKKIGCWERKEGREKGRRWDETGLTLIVGRTLGGWRITAVTFVANFHAFTDWTLAEMTQVFFEPAAFRYLSTKYKLRERVRIIEIQVYEREGLLKSDTVCTG